MLQLQYDMFAGGDPEFSYGGSDLVVLRQDSLRGYKAVVWETEILLQILAWDLGCLCSLASAMGKGRQNSKWGTYCPWWESLQDPWGSCRNPARTGSFQDHCRILTHEPGSWQDPQRILAGSPKDLGRILKGSWQVPPGYWQDPHSQGSCQGSLRILDSHQGYFGLAFLLADMVFLCLDMTVPQKKTR